MATPTPGEPFREAAGEAVQNAVMATRLVLAIADAVRRHQQRRQRRAEEEQPPAQAVTEAAEGIRNLLPPDLSAALTTEADWPQMAQQLVALQRAGVDMGQFLPRLGEIAVTVQDAVAANAPQTAGSGTGEWVRTLRETMPAGPVREAILSSPNWPDIEATMSRLHERGVDVRRILASAHDEGLGVDQAVAKVLAAGVVPTTSRDALHTYGPLTTGLDVPKDLDLSDRDRAMRQLAIDPVEHSRYAGWVMAAMPGRDREARELVSARLWPLLAARMAQMEYEGKPVREHLARLMADTSWEQGPAQQLGARLVQASIEALCRPLEAAAGESKVVVNTTAARAQSATAGPTRPQAKNSAPAEPGVVPHRSQNGPAPTRGKTR